MTGDGRRFRDAAPDHPAYVAEPREGGEVAARLGLEIVDEIGWGSDGTAFRLSDGRVLKVTASETEAAVAALLIGRAAAGRPQPGFPRVDAVFRMEGGVEVGDRLVAVPYFALVREDVADLGSGWTGGNDWPHWTFALGALGKARLAGRAGVPDLGLAGHCAPHVEAVFDAIAGAARDLRIAITDVRSSNLGLSGGRVVIRDFGLETLPGPLEAVAAAIPEIPDRPGPGPSPGF